MQICLFFQGLMLYESWLDFNCYIMRASEVCIISISYFFFKVIFGTYPKYEKI